MVELRAADVTPAELIGLLRDAAPPAGETAWCWLEAADGWTLDFWPSTQGTVRVQAANRQPVAEKIEGFLPRVIAGRVFSPSGELRWRVLPALGERSCRVVFLGEPWGGAGIGSLQSRNELDGLTPVDRRYPLWGQQTHITPGEWIELRIPHRLRYPISSGTSGQGRVIATLRVQLWKNRRGEVQFLRLCSLDAMVES